MSSREGGGEGKREGGGERGKVKKKLEIKKRKTNNEGKDVRRRRPKRASSDSLGKMRHSVPAT